MRRDRQLRRMIGEVVDGRDGPRAWSLVRILSAID
jgi:hypothetical protein